MNSFIHFPATYRFIPTPDPETGDTAAGVEQTSAPVAKVPAQAPAIDLDSALNLLDAELEKLDELVAKDREFPGTIASIEGKLRELDAQDLETLPALEARQSQVGKLSNMRLLANNQAAKTKSAISARTKLVIDIGAKAAGLAEQLWWTLRTTAVAQAEREFSRLFYHSFEHANVLNRFKPLVLLDWLRIPDFCVGATDTKIIRARQLRTSVNRLREFAGMSFQEVSDELEAQDREARERRLAKPAGYPGVALEASPVTS
jgi:hypothetical protein